MRHFSGFQCIIGIFITVKIMSSNGNQVALHRAQGEGYATFREHPLRKLNVTPTFAEAVKTHKQCLRDCVANRNCFSANFGQKEIFKGVFKCELLSKDRYNASSSFVSDENFFHYSIKTKCLDSPCQNNGICNPNYYEDTYKCVCKSGLQGQHCEEDIDECTTSSNDCSVNATCVNVFASYNCVCNEGFTGDGKTCTVVESEIPLEESAILKHIDSHPALSQLLAYLPSLQTGAKWMSCWRAAHDGWDVEQTFHPFCDGKGRTVTLIRKDGYVYGGYADKSWQSAESLTRVFSTNAFIFSLTNINGYEPLKLNVVDTAKALFHDKNYGPIFGPGFDMNVGNNAATTTDSYTRPRGYPNPPGYCPSTTAYCEFYAGMTVRHSLSDVEVFYEKL